MSAVNYKGQYDINEVIEKVQGYLEDFDKELFMKAFKFSERAHRGQFRKDNKTPYIAHPVAVADILTGLHADQDILMSALMHDVPEDTKYSINDVEKRFGKKIAFMVNGITKLSKVYYRNNMSKRSVESLKKLFLHSVEDPRVILIKLADRLHNMSTLEAVNTEKQVRIASETLEIYVPIANLLGILGIKRKLENLCFKHLYPHEYWLFKEKINSLEKRQSRLVKDTITRLNRLLKDNLLNAEVVMREYNLYSIYKRIMESGKNVSDIDDRLRIQIIVEKASDCYLALGLIHSQFKPKHRSFKDYIANPKFNTYQSLHTSIFGIDGILTEIQIATKDMMFQSNYGIAAHFFSKKKDFTQDQRSSWVNKIIELDKNEKNDQSFMENLKREILQDKILVFTPKGDTIYLPQGATVIDFAYAIHSEVGKHASEARINGNKRNITDVLSTGDVVKVMTSQGAHPQINWLSFVKTSFAKENIKSYLKKESRKMKIQQGRSILQKEFDLAALGPIADFQFDKINSVVQKKDGRSFKDWTELFMSIGEGDVDALTLVKNLDHPKKKGSFFRYGVIRYLRDKTLKRGLNITVKIVGKNRFGQLGDISKVFYKYSLDIWSFKASTSPLLTYSYFYVQIIVNDIENVIQLFDELEHRDDVYEVRRIYSTGMYILIALVVCIVTMTVLFFLDQKAFFTGTYLDFQYDSKIIISNLLLLLLFFGTFHLNKILKIYSPSVRESLLVKVFLKWLPVVLMGILFYELLYYVLFKTNFYLASAVFLIAVAAVFTYNYLRGSFSSKI